MNDNIISPPRSFLSIPPELAPLPVLPCHLKSTKTVSRLYEHLWVTQRSFKKFPFPLISTLSTPQFMMPYPREEGMNDTPRLLRILFLTTFRTHTCSACASPVEGVTCILHHSASSIPYIKFLDLSTPTSAGCGYYSGICPICVTSSSTSATHYVVTQLCKYVRYLNTVALTFSYVVRN
ncbi:hypothetical protein BJV78DRAFT_802445 [Lactifluus subvellereus]|nr:hypothetical protein BJV78DRAFT_802445 [Lactifluus subvellereus]